MKNIFLWIILKIFLSMSDFLNLENKIAIQNISNEEKTRKK